MRRSVDERIDATRRPRAARRRRVWPAWSLGLALLCSACCPRQPGGPFGPRQVLEEYLVRVHQGDHQGAWELLAADSRSALKPADLRAFSRKNPEVIERTLRELGDPRPLGTRWQTVLADGGQVVLVREAAGWRIASGTPLPPTGATPQQALEALLRAIEQGDCRALVRCAPPEVRARRPIAELEKGCVRQLESLRLVADKVRGARAGLVVENPNRAFLPYGEHRRLVLVKRGQRWYVEDL